MGWESRTRSKPSPNHSCARDSWFACWILVAPLQGTLFVLSRPPPGSGRSTRSHRHDWGDAQPGSNCEFAREPLHGGMSVSLTPAMVSSYSGCIPDTLCNDHSLQSDVQRMAETDVEAAFLLGLCIGYAVAGLDQQPCPATVDDRDRPSPARRCGPSSVVVRLLDGRADSRILSPSSSGGNAVTVRRGETAS